MTFRWYGKENDSIPLAHIKHIPGVTGLVWALHKKQAGEIWLEDEINEVKKQADEYGFNIEVVESINVHEDIKLGKDTRDEYIENYKTTLKNLKKFGVKVVCYNFMPIFDWTRTELFKEMQDGSTALFFEKDKLFDDPMEMVENILKGSQGYTMPGWEPERLSKLKELFDEYKTITKEDVWNNLQYFLEQIIPVAKECGIKMAIHPDDPPWDIFGLPRLITNRENIKRFLSLVDDEYNGLTLCSGSLGASKDNDIPQLIREFGSRIHFAHIRNVKRFENGDFIESSHRDCDGDVKILQIVKAYHDIGFTGYIRPDHGRHIFDEKCRPGYGLYDRSLGIMYMLGIWDTLEQLKEGK
jgi:mannonate dehydratase